MASPGGSRESVLEIAAAAAAAMATAAMKRRGESCGC